MKKITAPNTKYSDMRDAFFEELFVIAKKDKDVILLHADQGVRSFEKFYKEIPTQIINAGIAEQNMINVAAGLALSGKKVFVHAIVNFATIRCLEQIKVNLSLMNLPVVIAGIGGGLTYGSDGPTHHANQDLAAMRAIPHMRILNASDNISLSVFPHLVYKYPGLTYIRFDKGNYPELYDKKDNFLDGLKEVQKGNDGVIVTTGVFVHKAIEITKALETNNLKLGVIDVYRLKPLNEKLLYSLIKRYPFVITLDEHLSYSGVGTIISDFLTDHNLPVKFLRFGFSDGHCFTYGDRDYMLSSLRLNNQTLIKNIRRWTNNKKNNVQ